MPPVRPYSLTPGQLIEVEAVQPATKTRPPVASIGRLVAGRELPFVEPGSVQQAAADPRRHEDPLVGLSGLHRCVDVSSGRDLTGVARSGSREGDLDLRLFVEAQLVRGGTRDDLDVAVGSSSGCISPPRARGHEAGVGPSPGHPQMKGPPSDGNALRIPAPLQVAVGVGPSPGHPQMEEPPSDGNALLIPAPVQGPVGRYPPRDQRRHSRFPGHGALLRWQEWDRPAAVEAGFLKLRWRAR